MEIPSNGILWLYTAGFISNPIHMAKMRSRSQWGNAGWGREYRLIFPVVQPVHDHSGPNPAKV